MSGEQVEQSVGQLLEHVQGEGLAGVVDALLRAGAAAEQRPLVFKPVPNDPRGRHVMIDPKGQVNEVEVGPPPRSTTALTLGSFVDLVKYHHGRIDRQAKAQEVTGLNGVAVFVSLDKVVARLIEGDPSSGEVVLPLKASSGITALGSAAQGRTQKEFLTWLRTQVCGRISPAGLIETLRALKVSTGVDATAEVQTGKESLSRAVKKEVKGGSDIPDEVSIEVPVWDGVRFDGVQDCTVSQLCRLEGGVLLAEMPFQLDVDIDTLSFRLLPFAGAVEQARVDALSWLTGHLTAAVGESAKVFAGVDGYRLRPLV